MINKIILGDNRITLKDVPDGIANTCVTSPPYFGLRDYGNDGQIGLEETPEQFVEQLVQVFREVKRILKDDGTLWLNLGDSYAGGAGRWGVKDGISGFQGTNKGSISQIEVAKKWKHDVIKPKDLIGIPWMLAFALRADGWYLRQDIIWHKPNPMPESVTDRCTKSHEYIFLLSKSKQYYYDAEAIQEPCVWDTGGLTEKRVARAEENHKAMPTTIKNGIRPKKKRPQTFGGKKSKIAEENGGDPRRGHRSYENSQWSNVWESEKPTRNKRSVWTIATRPFKEAHFATFPEELIIDCIKAGCPEGGLVLDPFGGAGTTAIVARKLNRNYLLCELNQKYIDITEKRIFKEIGIFK